MPTKEPALIIIATRFMSYIDIFQRRAICEFLAFWRTMRVSVIQLTLTWSVSRNDNINLSAVHLRGSTVLVQETLGVTEQPQQHNIQPNQLQIFTSTAMIRTQHRLSRAQEPHQLSQTQASAGQQWSRRKSISHKLRTCLHIHTSLLLSNSSSEWNIFSVRIKSEITEVKWAKC